MLAIEINGEYLDLPPGTQMELESLNTLLQFDEELQGDYSLPFTVYASNKNMRLLNYPNIPQQRVDTTGVDAKIYNNGVQIAGGKVKIEKSDIDLLDLNNGVISCYYLGGAASFYQDVKDMNLRDIDTGGDRTFPWEGKVTTGSGFYAHVYNVMKADPGSYDYAFFPVKNENWSIAFADIDIMNFVVYKDGDIAPGTSKIVPFPYLKYVMEKACESAGWSISGDPLEDETFQKITMINFRAINYCYYKALQAIWGILYRDQVVFNLSDHLPDMTVGDFLIQLKNRFGWSYNFDRRRKKITVNYINTVNNTTPKDLSEYVSRAVSKTVNQDKNIYALRNNFVTDLGDGSFDLSLVDFKGNVNTIDDLPAASDTIAGQCYLVLQENNYYICDINTDTEAFEWNFFAYNIYDYAPENSTKDISTGATTVGMEYVSGNYGDNYEYLIPRIDNQGEWESNSTVESSWGIHLCFFHGLKNNKIGQPYPYGSNHIYDVAMNQVADWGLSFECFKTDGTDVGIYTTFWKSFLDTVQSNEEFEITLYLPIAEYLKLQSNDTLIINAVKMYITKIKETLPYDGEVVIDTLRI